MTTFHMVKRESVSRGRELLTRALAETLRCPRINLEELREGRLATWLAENGSQ